MKSLATAIFGIGIKKNSGKIVELPPAALSGVGELAEMVTRYFVSAAEFYDPVTSKERIQNMKVYRVIRSPNNKI